MSNVTISRYPDGWQVKFYNLSWPDSHEGGKGIGHESAESILHRSLIRTRKKVYDYSRCNSFDYFVTLTFNPQFVDSFDYDLCVSAMSQWLKNLKKRKCPNMEYIGVPELHKSGRYHFHFLMSNIDGAGLVDSGHVTKLGQTVYNVGRYTLGWSTAIKIYESGAKLATYLSKYISKDIMSLTKGRKRYWCSRGLALPWVECATMSEDALRQFLSDKHVTFEKDFSSTICDGKIIEFIDS